MIELIYQSLQYFICIWVFKSQLDYLVSQTENEKLYFILGICNKCLTFFITFVLTSNVFVAGLSAFMYYINDNFLNKTKL